MGTGYVISLKFILYASPEKVFNALTQSDLIEKWSHTKGELQPKKNGTFNWFDNWVKGKVTDAVKNESIIFTWKASEWGKNSKESIVAIQLNEHEAGTEIILHHTDLPSEDEQKKHRNGWIDYVFDPLNDYFSLQMANS